MTISSTTTKVSYSGTGSQTAFAYTFKIFADSEMQVIIRSSTGTETTKTLTTHYTVSGAGADAGGTVTFTAGNIPASGETVVLRRNLALTQGTDYVENDPFPAESHEDGLDRLTMITQGLQEELDRSIKASKTNTISSTEFAIGAVDRANKIFAFDAAGDVSVTQELGTFVGNWSASTDYNARDIVKDTSTANIFFCKTSHTSSGSQPLTTNTDSAKWDLLVDAAAATTSATAAAASATAAASSATASASSATSSATAQSASETAQAASEAARDSATASASSATASAATATTKSSEAATSATAAAASATSAAGNAGTQSVDRFNGNGSTTAFTMSASPATENNTAVYISGVYQQKDTYSTSGTTLTFSTAPPTGTGNIEVMHMSTLPTGVSPTVGTTTTGAAGTNASVSISGHELSFTIPRGDTGATGAAGQDVTSVTVSAVSPGGSPTATYNSGTGALALGIVTGDTGATGPAGSVAGMADGSAAAPSLAFASDTNTGLFRVGADQLGFTTAGTSAMTIDASQNVAVTGGVDVTGALTVDGNTTLGDASGDSITMNASTVATPNGLNFDSNTLVIDQTNNRVGVATASPAHALHVTGDIYASGNVTAYSSAAAKTNIATIPDALDIVQRLRGVSFDWRSTGKKSHGLIYEEVAEVVPELTSNEGGHVGVAYQNTVAVLIEAVKTLSAKVKELEAK